jgi:hypothetical protein
MNEGPMLFGPQEKRVLIITAVLVVTLLVASWVARPRIEPPKLTESVRADIRLMQERVDSPGGTGSFYAPERAIAAAQRVFAALPLIGMTRQEVVAVLGEPAESIAPSGSPVRGRLNYRFDGGYGGWEYLLTIDQHSRVTKVIESSLD